jgi:hypothetical protein
MIGEPDFVDPNGRAYEQTIDRTELASAVKSLRIIPDERNQEQQFAEARRLITEGEVILLSGFRLRRNQSRKDRCGWNARKRWARLVQARQEDPRNDRRAQDCGD